MSDWEKHRAEVTAEVGFYPPDRDHVQLQGGGHFEITGSTFGAAEDPDDELGFRVKWDGIGEEPERPLDLRGAPFVHWFTPNRPTQAHIGDRWTRTPRTAALDRHEALTKVAVVTAAPLRRDVDEHIPTCKDHNGGQGLAHCDEFVAMLRRLPRGDLDYFLGGIS